MPYVRRLFDAGAFALGLGTSAAALAADGGIPDAGASPRDGRRDGSMMVLRDTTVRDAGSSLRDAGFLSLDAGVEREGDAGPASDVRTVYVSSEGQDSAADTGAPASIASAALDLPKCPENFDIDNQRYGSIDKVFAYECVVSSREIPNPTNFSARHCNLSTGKTSRPFTIPKSHPLEAICRDKYRASAPAEEPHVQSGPITVQPSGTPSIGNKGTPASSTSADADSVATVNALDTPPLFETKLKDLPPLYIGESWDAIVRITGTPAKYQCQVYSALPELKAESSPKGCHLFADKITVAGSMREPVKTGESYFVEVRVVDDDSVERGKRAYIVDAKMNPNAKPVQVRPGVSEVVIPGKEVAEALLRATERTTEKAERLEIEAEQLETETDSLSRGEIPETIPTPSAKKEELPAPTPVVAPDIVQPARTLPGRQSYVGAGADYNSALGWMPFVSAGVTKTLTDVLSVNGGLHLRYTLQRDVHSTTTVDYTQETRLLECEGDEPCPLALYRRTTDTRTHTESGRKNVLDFGGVEAAVRVADQTPDADSWFNPHASLGLRWVLGKESVDAKTEDYHDRRVEVLRNDRPVRQNDVSAPAIVLSPAERHSYTGAVEPFAGVGNCTGFGLCAEGGPSYNGRTGTWGASVNATYQF